MATTSQAPNTQVSTENVEFIVGSLLQKVSTRAQTRELLALRLDDFSAVRIFEG
jgi:hypothetical protein